MSKDDATSVEWKRSNLTHLLNQLGEQEDIIKGLIPRSASWQGAPDSVMKVLRHIFREAADALPEKRISFDDNNDLDGLRAQLSSLRAKVTQALTEIGGKPTQLSAHLPAPQSPASMSSSKSQGRNDPDWAKQGVIAAWAIGVPTVALTVIGYLFPPDPTHPLGFSFLLRLYPIPAWLIGTFGAAIIWLAMLVWRARSKPQTPSQAAAERIIGELSGKLADSEYNQREAQEKISALETENRNLQQKLLPRRIDAMLRPNQQPVKPEEPNPLLADGSNEFIAESPDDFFVRITRLEDKQVKGLILGIENRRLEMIGPYRLRILSARSYDSNHHKYRDNADFMAFSTSTTKPTGPSCTGENTWLVRKVSTNSHLQAGNQSPGNVMQWPNADRSPVQRWLLRIDVSTQTLPKPGEQPVPLRPVELDLHLVWNPEKNEFFIDDAPGALT